MDVRRYESVVVFSPRLTEAQVKDEIKKFEGVLTSNKATVSSIDQWGRKEAAYSFRKERQGHYVVFNYETDNHEAPAALQSLLRIADTVNKFQTHLIRTKARKFKGNPKRLQQPRGDGDDFDFGGDSFE
jgi:small subunit ribosomal protein S6